MNNARDEWRGASDVFHRAVRVVNERKGSGMQRAVFFISSIGGRPKNCQRQGRARIALCAVRCDDLARVCVDGRLC